MEGQAKLLTRSPVPLKKEQETVSTIWLVLPYDRCFETLSLKRVLSIHCNSMYVRQALDVVAGPGAQIKVSWKLATPNLANTMYKILKNKNKS